MDDTAALKKTPLHALHLSLGARMVPFAGYDMPVQYPAGVMKEHLHTRTEAGLFDVSHMGQVIVKAKSGSYEDAALALESLVPVDILGLAEGRQRYGFFTDDTGCILDDLMITHLDDHLFIVVNAACKEADVAHLKAHIGDQCDITVLDRALIALQGPRAVEVLAELWADVAAMKFMDVRHCRLHDVSCLVSRSGYSGEDGFEISIPSDKAVDATMRLLEHPDVQAIGLGARDSLRLEAGLCLYGNDIDTTTSPVEAALEWAMQKARRGHAKLYADAEGKVEIGEVTSGGFGPSVEGPVAMGYVPLSHAAAGTLVYAEVRGKYLPITVSALPFVTPTYKR